jgi:hypothetical protein
VEEARASLAAATTEDEIEAAEAALEAALGALASAEAQQGATAATLDSALALAGLRKGYQARTAMGWPALGIEAPTGEYIVAAVSRGREKLQVTFADIMAMLALHQWDSGDADFRLWNPAAAVGFILNWAGVPSAGFALEDLGFTLEWSSWGSQEWRYRDKQVLDMVADILWRGQAHCALWYDIHDNTIKSGCPYCRTARTADNYLSHQSNGWNSSGCVVADVARAGAGGVDVVLAASSVFINGKSINQIFMDGESERSALSRQDYANKITVYGQTPDGQEIAQSWTNQAAIAPTGAITDEYLGWVVSKVVRDTSLQSMTALAARMEELKQAAVEDAFELRNAKTPLQLWMAPPPYPDDEEHPGAPATPTALRGGHVVMIQGGNSQGINELKLRVKSVSHDAGSGYTTFTAREMRGPSDA